LHLLFIFRCASTRLYPILFFSKLGCNIWQVLTKPSSVELPAAVLGFEDNLLGGFRVAGWFGGIKQATYLWQR
jgi:hypothetical protein